jgi:hypothetical protein
LGGGSEGLKNGRVGEKNRQKTDIFAQKCDFLTKNEIFFVIFCPKMSFFIHFS